MPRGKVAKLLEPLPSMPQTPSLIPNTHEPGVVAHDYNLSIQEAEGRR